MKIGQVSRRYGISRDNLYYYINYGLLVPPRRNNQYVFDDDTLRDLEWILELKNMEYSLAEIHRILSLRRISGLENPRDRADLREIYSAKRDECARKIRHYEAVIRDLDSRIVELSSAGPETPAHTGVPLRMLDLLCCPRCGRELTIGDVTMDMKYIYDGSLYCDCGYEAHIDDGILITPNGYAGETDKPDLDRDLYKDLPSSLISLFQRSYNNMKKDLSEIDLSGRVVMETYINAWFFLHNHQQYFSPHGFYIVVDKFPEMLRMYKTLIEQENYSLPILYLADSSTDYPLKKGIVDLNLDFFAVNEHLFYHDDFLLDRLSPYLKEDGRILGTWFYFKNGQRSMKLLKQEYPESSPNNFSLPWFRQQLARSGFALDRSQVCGHTTDSGNNLGFGFHVTGDEMYLMTYLGHREQHPRRAASRTAAQPSTE